MTCQREQIAEQDRTFDVVHLFFVPILPLGFRKRWRCTVCGNDPHVRTRTSRRLMVLFGVVSALLAVIFWMPPFVPRSDTVLVWTLRLLFSLAPLWIALWIRTHKPNIGLAEGLSRVSSLPMDTCLYCGGDLDRDGICAACAVRREQVGPRRWTS